MKEELLWDKRNKEPNDIKKIMAEIIRTNLINEEDPSKYEIYFYEKFHPELLIKKGLFHIIDSEQSSEFFIPIEINVNLDGINYIDNLNWDLLDKELIPEKFAENTVKDENLPEKFILPIAYQIRKGIRNYVHDLFKFFRRR